MDELLMVEKGSFHNLPEVVKLELCSNPLLSYIDPQTFRSVRHPRCIGTSLTHTNIFSLFAHPLPSCHCSNSGRQQQWLGFVSSRDIRCI